MKIFIFHGTYTAITENWFASYDAEMTRFGHTVIRPQFPIDNFDALESLGEQNVRNKKDRLQTLENWSKYFEENVIPQCDDNSIWIGHSLGPVFMLHMLSKFDVKLKGAIFLCPFLERLPDVPWMYDVGNSDFYSTDFDKDRLRERLGFSYVIYSTNDPYVPTTHALNFANLIDATVVPVIDGHHLGGKYKRLPLVEELTKTLLGYERSTDPEFLN